MPEQVKREPAAEFRTMAAAMRQMHLALVDEGFTSAEALIIIGQVLAANRPS